MRFLLEASGSLTSAYLIDAVKSAGHTAIASDIDSDCHGAYLADDFCLMPKNNDPNIWQKIEDQIKKYKIDIVVPSFDETLHGWGERKSELKKKGVSVIISPAETLEICLDKWLTYLFFKENKIPTPETSLEQDYPLIKPRLGRGSQGVRIEKKSIEMEGLISQEVIRGTELTVDTFFDRDSNPIYIVPRKRLNVKEGKSTRGIVIEEPKCEFFIKEMAQHLKFIGPVNFQCFINNNEIHFIEINPRIAGGMALGFAATENWIDLIVKNFIEEKKIDPKKINYGIKMMRYYAELFVS